MNVIKCILYTVTAMEVVQLMQWNTNDYIQQFHILEHKQGKLVPMRA